MSPRLLLSCGEPSGDLYAGALTREAVAARYNLPASEVKFFYCDHAYAIKASIPRPFFQGDPRDSDGHGGQQYAPLMDIEIA